jgi:hypothetical protein
MSRLQEGVHLLHQIKRLGFLSEGAARVGVAESRPSKILKASRQRRLDWIFSYLRLLRVLACDGQALLQRRQKGIFMRWRVPSLPRTLTQHP